MSLESGVLVGFDNQPIYWHEPPNRTVGSLPDSRPLWDVIWEHRKGLRGIAHSHPGSGKGRPSNEDLTTFRAIQQALGKELSWWIVTKDDCCLVWLRHDAAEGQWFYWVDDLPKHEQENLPWLYELREKSYEKEGG